jgi:hypothetical protein
MKISNIITFFCGIILFFTSCSKEFETFPNNPNLAGENGSVPPEYLLRELLNSVRVGADRPEEPLTDVSRLNQYTTGLTFPLYGGSNLYNWSSTGDSYPWVRNIEKLNENATRALGTKNNPYLTLGKFLRVYSFIWLTQRVGDIPTLEAGKGLANPTPKFDSQEDIYLNALNTLDTVNKELATIAADVNAPKLNGDIYFGNNLTSWRRAVNAYQLRLLISLSKRADDSPKLQVKERFAKIVNTPTDYPLYRNNADNWNYNFLPVTNRYPTQFLRLYSLETTVSKTILDLLKNNIDPRIFIVATPAPGQIAAGKKVDDFEAYNGSDNSRGQGTLFTESQGTKGLYSYVNYIRYLRGPDFIAEPYIMCGYSEMCFNIAEAANRGWLTADAAKYYEDGVKASLLFYGIAQGTKLTISNATGAVIGEATANVNDFLTKIKYIGNNANGLQQILEQKYVAFWQNSGWEAFYQFRRTGIPKFSEGSGTNSQGKIPSRWLYPVREVVNNPINAKLAIDKQFGGKDDVFAIMWLVK